MKVISCGEVPAAGGHYSHVVEAGGLVFVSGMLPSGNNQPPAPFEAQVHSAWSTGRPSTGCMPSASAATDRRGPSCRCRRCTTVSWSR